MKRILALLIVIGVFIGIFITLRAKFSELDSEVISEVVTENEVYVDSLNLPLIEVDSLNPLLTQNKQVSDILKLVYEPLFDFDEKNRIEAKLASAWSEKDGLTWIIKLNDKASWHSSKDLLADDIIFTYNAIKKSANSVYKENIKNILSIEKLEEKAIQINLSTEDKFLMYKLTFPIIPKYYFEGDLENEIKNINMVGTGPYKMENSSDENPVITLTANTNWWKQEEFKLNKIYLYKYATYGEAIKAFKSTEIDVIATSMSSWQKKFGAIGINNYMYPSSEFETIIPNIQNTLLSESSVRRMILSGINTENIIESIYAGNGIVSSCPIPSNSYLNNNNEYKNYDIEKAKQLLINAGWENSSGVWQKEINGKKYTLKFELLANSDNEKKVESADLIAENLKEIGIEIKIVKVNTNEYNKRIANGKFELILATLNLDTDIDLLELIYSDSEKNYAKYTNDAINKIILEMNKDNLQNKIMDLQVQYKNEAPYIGMYYKGNNLLTNKSVKGNINPTSWNVYHDITGWCK